METKEPIVGFQIGRIATEQFAMLPEFYQNSEPIHIQHELEFGADSNNKRIYVRKTARFQHTNDQVFLLISVGCHFNIKPEDWSKLQETPMSDTIIPKDVAIHLAMLTVGTLRGILHVKTENTIFNQYIFPPFDVTSLVPEALVF